MARAAIGKVRKFGVESFRQSNSSFLSAISISIHRDFSSHAFQMNDSHALGSNTASRNYQFKRVEINSNPNLNKNGLGKSTLKTSNLSKKEKPTTKKSKVDSLGPMTDWICVRNIPLLSTLDDLLRELSRVMNVESKLGIVDLDKAESILQEKMNIEIPPVLDADVTAPSLPMWNPRHAYPNFDSIPEHMVLEAHMMLSTLGRPNGWFIRLPNRSCVHAILSHIKEAKRIFQEESSKVPDSSLFPWKKFDTRPLFCGGQELKVDPFYPKTSRRPLRIQTLFHNPLKWGIGDNVIRVENCVREATEEDVTAFFQRFGLLDERIGMPHATHPMKAVQLIVQGSGKNENFAAKTAIVGRRDDEVTHSATSAFIVRFGTAADARSAVREKQNVEFLGRRLRLAQYSRQILSSEV